MITEKHVKICAGLYSARDSMRGLYGDRYPKVLEPYERILVAAKGKRKCDELHACLEIVEGLEGIQALLFIAAAVEMIEREAAKCCDQQLGVPA